MAIEIPRGFQGVLYDQGDRERRLEQKKWQKEIGDFRRAADYFERDDNHNWGRWYLLPLPSSHAARDLPRDLQARMEYVHDSLELEEFGAAAAASKVLREAADTMEAIYRERFERPSGWLEAAE